LQFRRLEGLEHAKSPGGLSITNGRTLRFTNEASVARLLALWEHSSTPPVYCQAANGSIRFRANWTTASGTALTLGSGPTKLSRVLRGKIGLVTSGGTANGLKYDTTTTAWALDATAGDSFEATALTPTGAVSNKFDPSAWVASVSVTAINTAAGELGGIGVMLWGTPARKFTAGSESLWIPRNTLDTETVGLAFAVSAPNDTVRFEWTSSTVDGVYSYINNSGGTAGEAFDLGLTPSDSINATTTLDIPAFPLLATAIHQQTTDLFPNTLNARVAGEVRVTRQGRTWVGVNAVRDMSFESSFTAQVSEAPSSGTTLFFSEVGTLVYPVDNYLTADVSGNVTALALLGDALVAFSKQDACVVTGNGPSDFTVRRLDSVRPGALEQESVQEWKGTVLYRGWDGIYRLAGDGSVTRVSDAIRDVFLTATEASTISSAIDRTRGTYLISVDGVGYALDLDSGAWSKLPFTVNALEGGPTVLAAEGAAVYSLDDASTSRTATLETDYLDLGAPQEDKRPTHLSLVFQNDTGSAGSVVVTLTPMSGTPVTLASQAIGTGYARLRLPLPGPSLVGRAVKVTLAITGKPGLTLVPPLDFEYLELGRRGR
jgi:hypothetical protein